MNPLFSSPNATTNKSGGSAEKLSDEEALCQLVLTGCFNDTFYSHAQEQVDKVLEYAKKCDKDFVAALAVFARQEAYMKDAPVLLLAYLSTKMPVDHIFNLVVTGGKDLRNFVQVRRSGVVGTKSLGSRAKRLVQNWIVARTPEQLWRVSMGSSPTMTNVIKLSHPKPKDDAQQAMFSYLMGKEYKKEALPQVVQDFLDGKQDGVPFEYASTMPNLDWKKFAMSMSYPQLRQSLNNLQKHGVLDAEVCAKLAEPSKNTFPYQLFQTWKATQGNVDRSVQLALHAAMEKSTKNIPKIDGKVYVAVDVSGSMRSPVTGQRGTTSSLAMCNEVASMIAAVILRKNPLAEVVPFHTEVVPCRVNPLDSITTITETLSRLPAGGTDCTAPIRFLVDKKVDVVILVSDNESWAQKETFRKAWKALTTKNPGAKLVLVDLQPGTTTQHKPGNNILQVGGWSDQCWKVIADWLEGRTSSLVQAVKSVKY